MNQHDWMLFAVDGSASAIGGSGKVFGTAGFQDILVLGDPGTIDLDASFNKGGDIVRLSGVAGDWLVSRSGSNAVFNDGDTIVQIPGGIAGMTVWFDDGPRLLRIHSSEQSLKIGEQIISVLPAPVTEPATISIPFEPTLTGAASTLLMMQDGEVAAAGNLNIFGTAAGQETVHLLYGAATFDASFNQGGDTLRVDLAASSFLARQAGSGLFLNSETTDAYLPAGVAGMTIEFLGGDARDLFIDMTVPAIFVGEQQIGASPMALTFA